MRIISHGADCFRNLSNTFIEADPSMNIIFGENGQGKTNIIESIWLFTGCYSFRTHKNSQLVCEGKQQAESRISFYSGEREQNAEMKISKVKEIVLNGSPCKTPRAMMGRFNAVVFSPSTLSVVKGGPGDRRKLVDIAISLIKPNYASVLARYLHTVEQRNALLKTISEKRLDYSCLDPWDEALSGLGAQIIDYRLNYLKSLKELSAEIYSGISSSREKFAVEYSLTKNGEEYSEKELKEKLFDSFVQSRESDLKKLYTGTGPHTDDLIMYLDGRDARFYGSQGQQRSCALALKLSEASIMGSQTGETPIVLLDDVMSELDEGRQNFILNYLDRWQVFITCCDPSQLKRSDCGRVFEVKNGEVTRR